MLELVGDLWDYHDKGYYVIITTNGFVKKNGECVMGRGVAQQAKQRFPELPKKLGETINKWGNRPYCFSKYKIITFPTKHVWWENSDIELIVKSARELVINIVSRRYTDKIYMVRPGCSNGGLEWTVVKPRIKDIFNDQYIVVEKYGN